MSLAAAIMGARAAGDTTTKACLEAVGLGIDIRDPHAVKRLLAELEGDGPPVIGTTRGRDDGRQFYLGEAGPAALVLPFWYVPEDLPLEAIDAVVWRPEMPSQVFKLTGLGEILGERALQEASEYGGGKLRLYATPAKWAEARAAGREGAWIAPWATAGTWRRLEEVKSLTCDDVIHAKGVHAITRRPVKRRLPEIKFVRA